jgi:hypothetical protein
VDRARPVVFSPHSDLQGNSSSQSRAVTLRRASSGHPSTRYHNLDSLPAVPGCWKARATCHVEEQVRELVARWFLGGRIRGYRRSRHRTRSGQQISRSSSRCSGCPPSLSPFCGSTCRRLAAAAAAASPHNVESGRRRRTPAAKPASVPSRHNRNARLMLRILLCFFLLHRNGASRISRA